MTNILVAIDSSPSAMHAVGHAANLAAGMKDGARLSLIYVLPNLPAVFWDEGHILSDSEKAERKSVVDRWIDAEKKKMEPLFGKALDLLVARGIRRDAVTTKFLSDSTDAAASILEEARDSSCSVVVVGRSHHSPKHVLGTTAARIANQAHGLAVAIVD